MISVDVHSHTHYAHGAATVQEMYHAGQAAGLKIHGFSEHSPRPKGYNYPVEYRDKLAASFDHYVADVMELALLQAHNCQVLLGLELDWIEAEPEFMAKVRSSYQFDYCIGGIHFLGPWGFDFSQEDWSNLDDEQCFQHFSAYFATFRRMAQSGMFHIAAHPDLIKIFRAQTFKHWIKQADSQEQVAEALKSLKKAGMLMEVSSAGLRKACHEIYPCTEIMALAADLQIPISFGSDAHCTGTMAYGFDQLAAYAHSFGYSQSAYICRDDVVFRSFE